MVANMSLIYDIARRSSRAPRLDQDYDGIVSVRCGYQIALIARVDSRPVSTCAHMHKSIVAKAYLVMCHVRCTSFFPTKSHLL